MGSDTSRKPITLQCSKLSESVLPFLGAAIDQGNAY